ncbi:MAG: hypothetical protein A2X49_09705 [Lentisphaerae bacterium GWF2_52_8]|nr:MAG: hypothetical protein A2X49_09705 [Lentisphaerae bacterium GWF2_52_8]
MNKIKNTVRAAAFVMLCILSSIVYSETVQDGIDTLTAKIEQDKKKAVESELKMLDKIEGLKKTFEEASRSESSLKGQNGLGRIEQMELKAELYGIEKQARKRLEKEFTDLSLTITEWQNCKKNLAEHRQTLRLQQKILDLETKDSSDQQPGAPAVNLDDIKNYEAYDVKKDATLREISAMPEVYGSADMWEQIYKANKNLIKDPAKPVPAGTKLKIPIISQTPKFDDLN